MKIQPRELEQGWDNLPEYTLKVTDTNLTVNKAIGIPFKTLNGIWRIKLNINATYSVAVSIGTFTVQGLVFSNDQCICFCDLGSNVSFQRGRANSGASTISWGFSGTTTTVSCSGDVELASKPAWME